MKYLEKIKNYMAIYSEPTPEDIWLTLDTNLSAVEKTFVDDKLPDNNPELLNPTIITDVEFKTKFDLELKDSFPIELVKFAKKLEDLATCFGYDLSLYRAAYKRYKS